MADYLDGLSAELKEYFSILEPNFPEFLKSYIEAPEMQRIGKISMFCGKDYSASRGVLFPVSNLDHSVGVALILWHFTHSKEQALAGLFHDIATPVFKHCVDFMNGDYENQESIEEPTLTILKNSKVISSLLKRDNIDLEKVYDYKIYPLADNPTPRLCADRVEYNFTCGMSLVPVFRLSDVRRFYNDIIVKNNEYGEPEFAFKTKELAEEYISKLSMVWPEWCNETNNTYMQFLADACKFANDLGEISVSDLYKLSEKEIIDKLKNSSSSYLSESFNNFLNTKDIYVSEKPVEGCYCVKIKVKRRYVVPLVIVNGEAKRINEVSEKAKKVINNYLNEKYDGYGYFEFDFNI